MVKPPQNGILYFQISILLTIKLYKLIIVKKYNVTEKYVTIFSEE